MFSSSEWHPDYLQFAILSAVQLIFVLHILVSKHENPPQAAFWLLWVTLLPGAGLICYIFFGITRIEHVHNRILKARGRLFDGVAPEARQLAELQRSLKDFQITNEDARSERMLLFDRLFPDHPALEGNNIELFQDGVAVYPQMLEDIRSARKSIRLQSYILNSDEVGRAFMDALTERAAAGVDVKVLFDSVGSFKSYFSQYFRKELRSQNNNFRMRAFSAVNLFAPWKFQLRNHRKLLVIDGSTAYVGGVNISAENEHLQHLKPSRYIHDLHCRITGPAAAQFTMSFLTDYFYTLRRSSKQKNIISSGDCTPQRRCGEAVVRVIPGGPGNIKSATGKMFFAAAALAQKELWIITPYFVPGHEYVDALCMASARGVDVRIVVPAKNNHFYVDLAAQNFYRRLHDAGVTIYEKLGYFSHAKAVLVDSEWGFMGSSNCDSRSFHLNFELDFIYEKSRFTDDMRQQFWEEFAGARKLTTYRLQQFSRMRKLINSIAALFTPIL